VARSDRAEGAGERRDEGDGWRGAAFVERADAARSVFEDAFLHFV
jgi:hypothetical protein